ncbi:MAG: hypothetical protein ACOVRG_01220 [Saprospiraceae bacterium]|jgi:hypothetical protein
MIVIRRFIFLLSCFLLLGKDVTYAYSLSHKLEIQLKQKHLKNGGDFINPFSVNDSVKLLIVENEEIEDDLIYDFPESYSFFPTPIQPNGSLVANSSLLFPLIINRVILFCCLKIDC